jgi:hypothetical protein
MQELYLVSRAYENARDSEEHAVFFAQVDSTTASDVFSMLNVTSVPHLLHIAAGAARITRAALKPYVAGDGTAAVDSDDSAASDEQAVFAAGSGAVRKRPWRALRKAALAQAAVDAAEAEQAAAEAAEAAAASAAAAAASSEAGDKPQQQPPKQRRKPANRTLAVRAMNLRQTYQAEKLAKAVAARTGVRVPFDREELQSNALGNAMMAVVLLFGGGTLLVTVKDSWQQIRANLRNPTVWVGLASVSPCFPVFCFELLCCPC